MKEGHCAREFRRFLKDFDKEDRWCGLSAKVDQDGHVFFACPDCCSGKRDKQLTQHELAVWSAVKTGTSYCGCVCETS